MNFWGMLGSIVLIVILAIGYIWLSKKVAKK
jgi:hypothetical protein